jgi:hypothetical protein
VPGIRNDDLSAGMSGFATTPDSTVNHTEATGITGPLE